MAIARTPEAAEVSPGTVLAAKDLTRQYGEGDSAVHALRGVSLAIPRGQFAAVMGPSGSGKSTLMHILAGLDTPTSGQVWVGDEEITEMDDDELTERVGRAVRRSHRPSELSGGQQQRVAIARALVSRPTILFADEPTGNLDSTMSEEILQALSDSVDSYGQTTMMVTHDASAAAVADRIVFLADGETVEDEYGLDEHDVLGTMERLAHR